MYISYKCENEKDNIKIRSISTLIFCKRALSHRLIRRLRLNTAIILLILHHC